MTAPTEGVPGPLEAGTKRVRRRRFQSKARSADDQLQLRNRFIEVGKALLADAGDGHVSLREIARIAGYSSSALYRYFPTKADLVYAVREDHLRLSTEHAQRRVQSLPDPTVRLCAAFESTIEFWLQHPVEFRCVYNYRPPPSESNGKRLAESSITIAARRFFEDVVEGFLRHQGLDPAPDLVKLLTDTLVVATHGVVSIPMCSPSFAYSEAMDMGRSVTRAFTQAWRGLAARHLAQGRSPVTTAEDYRRYLSQGASLAQPAGGA